VRARRRSGTAVREWGVAKGAEQPNSRPHVTLEIGEALDCCRAGETLAWNWARRVVARLGREAEGVWQCVRCGTKTRPVRLHLDERVARSRRIVAKLVIIIIVTETTLLGELRAGVEREVATRGLGCPFGVGLVLELANNTLQLSYPVAELARLVEIWVVCIRVCDLVNTQASLNK